MELCYDVEVRVKRMHTPDKSGLGPFTRADDLESAMRLTLYPQVIDNPETLKIVIRQAVEAFKAYYQRADGPVPAGPVQALQAMRALGELSPAEEI